MSVDLMAGCACGYDTLPCERKWRGHFYGTGANPAAAVLLSEPFDSLMARVKNGKRDARLADRAGCTTEVFDHGSWRPDLAAIHHSMPTRSGGAMKGHYRDTLEDMGGRVDMKPVAPDSCRFHWSHYWGIFAPEAGDTVSDRRLVGYIGLVRVGTTATYMQIMGHGDWLARGVMYRLHFALMEWALSEPAELAGCDAVWYTDFHGAPGLATWKKKAGFQEVYL